MGVLIKDVDKLEPHFRIKVKEFLAALDKAGIKYVIIETLRLPEVQRAYFDQGRLPLDQVNAKRKSLGLWEISAKENTRITNTLASKHIIGLAMDIGPSDEKGNILWNAPDAKWKAIADVAVECGLVAGYYWPEFKDPPHIEMKPSYKK